MGQARAEACQRFARSSPPTSLPPHQWRWSLLIRTPDFILADDLKQAVAVLLKRGKGEDVKRVELETLAEGRCIHMLHVGPDEKEGATVAVRKAFVAGQGLRLLGRHNEIYLSDPRHVPPERLKTILRIPVVARSADRPRQANRRRIPTDADSEAK